MNTPEQPTMADAARAIASFQAALAAAFAQAARRLAPALEAMRPMIEYFEQHPELLTALSEPAPEACHCLCKVTHGSLGICDGEVEPGLTVTRHSPTVGTVHIPMCRSCHTAAMATA